MKLIWMLFFPGSIFLVSLLPACNEKKEFQKETKKKEKSALSFIRNDDCLNCHNIEDKSVGPSYVQISQKYDADFTTVSRLANKVIEGGGGMWGSEQMTKHPFLKKEDAKKIIRWIFSLNDSIVNKNPLLHTPGIAMSEVFQEKQYHENAEKGLKISAYSTEQAGKYMDDFPEDYAKLSPMHEGVAKGIHFTRNDDFLPLQGNFLIRATGFIHTSKKGKYFFKLMKSGKGRIFLNGNKIINERSDDNEIVVDLEAGNHAITIEYLMAEKQNLLSLQWITPEDEYYRVIPEEVFSLQEEQSAPA
ncbi:PA14 domain-containing protein [Catalinimonas niigatensis]|uniref:PA14 domain-containing protein n=1 Tax=Catalinimonas niigatensis TaxID=1397264 RepID=UPI002667190A|nr:PA14 domain-containing protein [Catalinimonas niigatensis]WPP47998.1 PA14 domain-containing protein [Catalinimonas niigatensis]